MRTTAFPFARSQAALRPSRIGGFTLLELMLVITVAAVILGLGIPNMTQFIRNNRMTGAANDMLVAIHTARTEAVKRRAFVTFCFSANPNDATPICSNAGRGWVVFVDDANPAATSSDDGNFVVNDPAQEEVLLRHDALPAAITSVKKTTNTGATSTTSRGVSFAPSGYARTTLLARNVVLCDVRSNVAVYGDQNSAARVVEINQIGRPRVLRSVAEVTSAGGCP